MSGEFTIANHQSLATFLAMFGMMPEGNGLRLANDQKLFKPAKIHSAFSLSGRAARPILTRMCFLSFQTARRKAALPALWMATVFFVPSSSLAEAGNFHLALRRQMAAGSSGTFQTVTEKQQWKPAETAVIVCDMWDLHHCKNAVARVKEMAPRMNRLLEEARQAGALIIHAPSSCMDFYAGHPARLHAQKVLPAANLPQDIGQWCYQIPSEKSDDYPLDQSDGGEDDDPIEHAAWAKYLASMGRNPRAPWRRQYDALKIDNADAITDDGKEVWSLLEHYGIDNILLVGVHTNMCVLGRPFGLRQMVKNGKNVVLVRDLTDSMYNPKMRPYVNHYRGTELIIEYIEKYICPTVASDQILGGLPFQFRHAPNR